MTLLQKPLTAENAGERRAEKAKICTEHAVFLLKKSKSSRSLRTLR